MIDPTISPAGEAPRRRIIRTTRMEAFSDGVFAIAITLLVLELAIPIADGDDLARGFVDAWPSYLAYVVSFASIGAVWLSHTTITEYLDGVDGIFLRLNLLVLLVVSFLPFPTRVVAEHITVAEQERIAVTVYGINLFLAAALIAALWRYAVSAGLLRADATATDIGILTRRLAPGLVVYVALIAIGLLWPVGAVVGYLLIALFFLIPLRSSRQTRNAG